MTIVFGRPHQPSTSSAAALGKSGCPAGPRHLGGVEVVGRDGDDVGLRCGHRVVWARMIAHGQPDLGPIWRTGAPTRCQCLGMRRRSLVCGAAIASEAERHMRALIVEGASSARPSPTASRREALMSLSSRSLHLTVEIEGDAVVIAMGPWSVLAAQWLPLPPVFGLSSDYRSPGRSWSRRARGESLEVDDLSHCRLKTHRLSHTGPLTQRTATPERLAE